MLIYKNRHHFCKVACFLIIEFCRFLWNKVQLCPRISMFHQRSLVDWSRILLVSFFFKKVFCFILSVCATEGVTIGYWLWLAYFEFYCFQSLPVAPDRIRCGSPQSPSRPSPVERPPSFSHSCEPSPVLLEYHCCCLVLHLFVHKTYFHLIMYLNNEPQRWPYPNLKNLWASPNMARGTWQM